MLLAQITQGFEHELRAVEDTLHQGVGSDSDALASMVTHALSGAGKRIRPVLVLVASRLYPVDVTRVISLAAAVEALHAATLVHDDLIDRSPLRRGRPTVSAIWNTAATVLAGDYIFALAAGLAASTNNVRVVELFAKALQALVQGEVEQLFQKKRGIPPKADYYDCISRKTASLFTLAAEASGALIGASPGETKALQEYGWSLGMAFQIVDDVLDFIADGSSLGKPAGHDLRQGTVTLPVHCFAAAYPEHRALREYCANVEKGGRWTDELVEAIRASSAIAESRVEALAFARRAIEALNALPGGPPRASLEWLAAYVVSRLE